MALHHPDDYAWKLFFYLNRQALVPGVAGTPDLSKRNLNEYDPDKPVVWETWALSSGEDFSEAFPCGGSVPPPWEDLASARDVKRKPELETQPKSGQRRSPNDTGVAISFRSLPNPPGLEGEEEVRMNRANYESIVGQELWNQEGIKASVLQAQACGKRSFVTFPADAKEVKAVWVHLTACDRSENEKCATEKSHFHWRTVTSNNGAEVWGLAALRVITNDIPPKTKDAQPNWFWADFIQTDCLSNFHGHGPSTKICPPSGHEKDAFAQDPVDSSTYSGGITSDSPGNNKWHYYRLMGTETGFEAPLSDPMIETSTKPTSCITCHFYAATTSFQIPSALPLPNLLLPPPKVALPVNGTPDDTRLSTPLLYLRSDFEWSMLQHAQSITGQCVNGVIKPKPASRQVPQPPQCDDHSTPATTTPPSLKPVLDSTSVQASGKGLK